MVIAQINGGLGNQLFQFSAAKALSLYHNVPLLLEVSSFYREELPELEVPRELDLYHFNGVKETIISPEELMNLMPLNKKSIIPKKLIPAHKKKIYIEPHFHFDKNFFKARKNVLLKGGWQSEKYFNRYNEIIRETFQLKHEFIQRVLPKSVKFRKQNSIAVHIRRGDYLRKKIILEWHGVMDADYYKRAFEILKSKLDNFQVYYFTDDPLWVKSELGPMINGEIISGVISQTHFEDLYLMSQCRHNIIANSSFSWWGAWLNDNPEKIVIAPKKWFNKGPKDTYDLYPEGWIVI